ncbi:MAG: excinuclease ABC subunit UvrC [Clostridia bacterium]|nr:excinuclease ABC subunit UvrC [Clostridia bacterium]
MRKEHEHLSNKIKNLSMKPGVYIMKDKSGRIIYIGKAKALKNRVSQYFHDAPKESIKTERMVSNIHDFDYIVTDTELEALVLECNLIKLHKPKYNILLKDDKNFPYLKITLNDDYPKIALARKKLPDGAKYYGPYLSAKTINDTIWTLKRTFMIATCKLSFPRDIGKVRPCLNYHIKRCIGPCIGDVTPEQYHEIFDDIVAFIEGDYESVIKELEAKMYEASENMEYERARVFRDRIRSIERLGLKQKVVLDSKRECDVISYFVEGDILCFSVLMVRFGRLIDKKVIKQRVGAAFDEQESLSQFLKQFYDENSIIPKDIYLSAPAGDGALLEEHFSNIAGHKVRISAPKSGKPLELVRMSLSNAREEVRNDILSMEKSRALLLETKRMLDLPSVPARIEAYDVSNLGSDAMVGAMVVFKEGAPSKSDYKRFKIRTLDAPDDYAATKEIIYRRFEALEAGERGFCEKPDLILLDGGAGHLNAVTDMLSNLGIDVPVFGMVKNKSHRIRGLVSKDGELTFKGVGDVYTLLGRISEEVHRFAISYHRTKRTKNTLTSALDSVKGVGGVKRAALLKHFGSVKKIKEADISEIAQVKGINEELARRIKAELSGGDEK